MEHKLRDSLLAVYEALKPLIERIKEMWAMVREACVRACHVQKKVEVTKKLRQTWQVPIKINMRSQVVNRKPIRAMARANL